MLKIYVLTKGCYSDYHIITATTDYELACKIKDRFDKINSEWSDEKVNIEIYEDAEEEKTDGVVFSSILTSIGKFFDKFN